MLIPGERSLPLHDPPIGATDHADLAVAPGLGGDPVERIVAIGALLMEWIELAFRRVAPADVLHHHDVSAIDESLVAGRDRHTLVVWSALEDHWRAQFSRGKEYVGGQAHSVAHRDHHVEPRTCSERRAAGRC